MRLKIADKQNRTAFIYKESSIMKITKKQEGSVLEIKLEGRLDTMTSPQFEAEVVKSISGVTELVLDFSGLEYLSSAGLMVLLGAQKTMNKQGKMVVKHVNDTIMEVFDITGFSDILTIEK